MHSGWRRRRRLDRRRARAVWCGPASCPGCVAAPTSTGTLPAAAAAGHRLLVARPSPGCAVRPSSATSRRRSCTACRSGAPAGPGARHPCPPRARQRRSGVAARARRPAPGRRSDRRRWRGRHRPGPHGARPRPSACRTRPRSSRSTRRCTTGFVDSGATWTDGCSTSPALAGAAAQRGRSRSPTDAARASGRAAAGCILHRLGLSPSDAAVRGAPTDGGSIARPHRLRLGGAAARRRVRRPDQVRPAAAPRTERRRRRVRGEAPGGRDPRRGWGVVRWTWDELAVPRPLRRDGSGGRSGDADPLAGALLVLRGCCSTRNASKNTREAGSVRAGGPPASR